MINTADELICLNAHPAPVENADIDFKNHALRISDPGDKQAIFAA